MERVDMRSLLEDVGYVFNRRDGIKYPSYVRIGGDGRRVRGDKFIVMPDGKRCFQPPMQRVYNVISFIKDHCTLFADYKPGMKPDLLVNIVCNRILGNPVEQRKAFVGKPGPKAEPFTMDKMDVVRYDPADAANERRFAPFFDARGLGKETREAFREHFLIAVSAGWAGYKHTNLCFPMTKPGGTDIVGLEQRGLPKANGQSGYKGKAKGSNSSEGLWIANLSGGPLDKAPRVLWFESAYDAMAYHQAHAAEGNSGNVYVSTGGNPTMGQYKGMIEATPGAVHHLCFDNDNAGRMYAVNFILCRGGRSFSSHIGVDGRLVVDDYSAGNHEYREDMRSFDFKAVASDLGLGDAVAGGKVVHDPAPAEYKDWNDLILGKKIEVPQQAVAGGADREETVDDEEEKKRYYSSTEYNGVDIDGDGADDVLDERHDSHEEKKNAAKQRSALRMAAK